MLYLYILEMSRITISKIFYYRKKQEKKLNRKQNIKIEKIPKFRNILIRRVPYAAENM